MASNIPVTAFGSPLTIKQVSVALGMPAHQIRAALDPACAVATLVDEDQSLRAEVEERVGRLVENCARTGCPPCIRRVAGNPSSS